MAATASVLLLLVLRTTSGHLRHRLFLAPPAKHVELTIVTGAAEKGAVCLDGIPPGYHLQRGSGDRSNSLIIHLQSIAQTVEDWHRGRSEGAKEIACDYPCNPRCSI